MLSILQGISLVSRWLWPQEDNDDQSREKKNDDQLHQTEVEDLMVKASGNQLSRPIGDQTEVWNEAGDQTDASNQLGYQSVKDRPRYPSHVLPRVPSHEPEPEAEQFHDFPFLSEPDTVEYIRRSHTMFIMRGLPGSGKSMLGRQLVAKYPGAVVCSADDFFVDEEGNYNYDHEQIKDAHTYCQDKATEHCEKGTRVIIIDNTNIRRWSMSFYVRLAFSHHYYHLLVVEPMTPWQYDVEELFRRNSHGVEKDYIKNHLQSLRDQVFLPMYYGWFLSQDNSGRLAASTLETLRTCVEDVVKANGGDSPSEILDSWDSQYSSHRPMLHCTASYIGTNKSHPYHSSDIVQGAIGRTFTLQIAGFLYTQKSISAKVNLYWNQQKTADDKNLYSEILDLFQKAEESEKRSKYKDTGKSEDAMKCFNHGCSAHVTIKYAVDSQAKASGDDWLEVIERELHGKVKRRSLSIGQLSIYEGGMYHVTLNQPISVDCLFHGYYRANSR